MIGIRKICAPYLCCAFGVIGAFAFSASPGCAASESSENDEPQIEVRCGADLGLTPESGSFEDWTGAVRSWEAAIEEDRLVLRRRFSCGDECSTTEEIVLSGLSAECPVFVSASSTRADAGGALGRVSKTTGAAKGVLEIESWEPGSGVVSGRITSEVRFTFYVSQAAKR